MSEADIPNADTECCPECDGTGRVPRRELCKWCETYVAEHACGNCGRRLCEECVFDGLCPPCDPGQAHLADSLEFLPGEVLA